MHDRIKQLIKHCARLFGAELVASETLAYWQRQSQEGVLNQLKTLGVEINTVLDVGAAHGDWSLACARIFPDARYEMFEPLDEYAPRLNRAVGQLPRATRHRLALHRAPGEMSFNVHPDLVGSSFYLEDEDSDVNGEARMVQIETLDRLHESLAFTPPFLLKIDVQGAELDVLAGGGTVLGGCAFVICESSFFNFYDHGGTASETLRAMESAGFALYDVFGLSYRPLDGALAQADLCFVKSDGPLRSRHHFASASQRREVTARLRQGDTLPRTSAT